MLLDGLGCCLGDCPFSSTSRHCRAMYYRLFHCYFHHQYWDPAVLLIHFMFDARALLSFPLPFLSSFSTSLTLNCSHLVAWSQPTDNCQRLWNRWEYPSQSWNLLRMLCTPPAIYATLSPSHIPPTQKIFRGLGPLVHFLHYCFPVLWWRGMVRKRSHC